MSEADTAAAKIVEITAQAGAAHEQIQDTFRRFEEALTRSLEPDTTTPKEHPMSDQPTVPDDVDDVDDIVTDYDVVETVDVGPADDPTDDLPEELDVDYDEVPEEETAGE